MAITETGVVVTTLQGIQATYTEQGQALQIVMDGLTPNTAYQATAYCIENGIQSTSNTESFTTLVAGTIALTRQSMARQGSDYVIVYTYVSTYALSSSVLRVGNTATAQGVIAGNTITYTISGLTPGDAYIYDITSIDVYTETNNIQSSFVMPVVNTIDIVNTTPSDTEVEVKLKYTVDGGFYEGFVSCWESTQDPDTDPSLAHWAFYNGATTVICDNLTAGTTYKFRADIVLGDMTTEISSSVVTVTTVNALGEYFAINNLTNETAEFSVAVVGTVSSRDLNYSVDGGTTWTAYDFTTLPTVNVPANGNIKFRGTNAGGIGTGALNNFSVGFHLNKRYSISGNPSSMVNPDPAVFSTYTDAAHLGRVFLNETNLVDASLLKTSQYTRVRDFVFYKAFEGSGLQRPPRLNNVTLIHRSGMERAFFGCTALAEATDLSSLVELRGEHALLYTYKNCTSLTTGSNLYNLTTISNNGGMVEGMYEGCTSLVTAYSPKLTTWNENYFRNWLNGVSASGEVCVPTGMSLNVIPTDTVNGVPNGWWAHYC